ncbi:MAG: OFA family MFS transporter [Alkalispirochaeta sp.]
MTDKATHPRVYLALGMVLNMCLGTVYSWSVFRVPLESHFAVGSVASGLPYMIMIAVFSMTMPIGGLILKRIGPRRAALLGGLLLGGGWIVSSWAPTMGMVSLFWGGLGGMGVGVTYVVPLTMAHAWFPRHRGLAMGLVLGGFGMSPFVTAPVAELIIEHMGVRAAFRILGATFAVLIPALAASFHMPEPAVGDAGAGSAASRGGATSRIDVSPRLMVRTREFYALWLALLLGSIIGLGAIAITAPWAQRIVGLSGGAAALAVSVLAIFNGLGRPLFGFLTDHLGLRRTAISAFILTTLASITLIMDTGNSLVSFVAAFSVFWLLLGGWLAIAPAATAVLFGAASYAQNYGIVFQAYGLGAVLGTLYSGRLNDLFGSYRAVLWPILGASLVGIAISWWGFSRVKLGRIHRG